MESVVQCPVCTLFLHPGMSLEDHLNTHPKDQVIQALSQLTLQRANILSTTQFSPAKPLSPVLSSSSKEMTLTQEAPNTILVNKNEVNGNQIPFESAKNSNNALLIQVQGTGNVRASPQIYHHLQDSTPKNLMIVNQYVQQRINVSNSPPRSSQSTESTSLIPRYTSERYSGPPPPYSTAISSKSSNESNASDYDVKAHYMEKDDGHFLVTESPQKIIEYSEDENGVLTLSEKIIKSPPRLVPCGSDDENEERGETLYASEPVLVESLDEVRHVPKKKTDGLKVLSNVKITTDMISPGLQEILLNNNRKGRRINKILNKRPQESDLEQSSQEMEQLSSNGDIIDLHVPSTSHEDSYEQFRMSEQDESMRQENDELLSPPPLSATPTSVIRTINDVADAVTPIKVENPPIMSPKPSTSSQDSHLNINCRMNSNVKIGKPIVQKPKKLTLKLKNAIPVQDEVKVEPIVSRDEHVSGVVKMEDPPMIDSREQDNLSQSTTFTITYVDDVATTEDTENLYDSVNDEEKTEYYPNIYPETNNPLPWVQRFSPQYVPFEERNSYNDIDGDASDRNGQSSNSFDEHADSSLNIQTDEKMPAKGEISEQESNGEIENWNHVHQDPIQQYPSSYDLSTAQECWNLSNNKQEFMQHQHSTL